MLIFAIFSIPAFFVVLEKEISNKKIILFVHGVIFSSILSLIMWALSTLYIFNSDTIFFKSIKIFVIQIIPIVILFYFLFYIQISKRSIKKISSSFVSGFLYWNLLFYLLTNKHIDSTIIVFLLPIFYLSIMHLYYSINDIQFIINDRIIKNTLIAIVPFFIFIFYVTSIFLNVLSIIFLLILVLVLLLFKTNAFKIKEKILI